MEGVGWVSRRIRQGWGWVGLLTSFLLLGSGGGGACGSREGGKSCESGTGGVGEDSVVMVPVGATRMRIRRGPGFGAELNLRLESGDGEACAVVVVVASWTACVRVRDRALRPVSEERMLHAWGQLKCCAAARSRSRWWASM